MLSTSAEMGRDVAAKMMGLCGEKSTAGIWGLGFWWETTMNSVTLDFLVFMFIFFISDLGFQIFFETREEKRGEVYLGFCGTRVFRIL